MIRWLVRRALHLLIVVLGVYTALFLLLRLTGDPALLYVSEDAGPAQIQRVREQLGLADPLPVQYLRFLGRAMVGDFGLSLRHNQPALPLVLASLPATLELTGAALFLAALIGVPVGILSATRRNSVADHLCLVASLIGQCVPTFWLGIILILILTLDLGWLPSSGRGTLAHLLMPALTLGAYSIARVARLTRSSVLEVLNQDFVRTARSKGLAERVVILRHVLKNAAVTIVTILGLTDLHLAGRGGHHRNDLRLARCRPSPGPGGVRARLPDRPGYCLSHRRHGDGRHLGDRRAVRVARPAYHTCVDAALVAKAHRASGLMGSNA